MDQLVEAVLPVRARLTPVDGAGLVVDVRALDGHVLAVRLHRELLQVGREALEVLLVRHHADGLRVEEVAVPDREQAHDHRQVLRERRGAEVHVHVVEAGEHLVEAVGADREHRRQADRRVHRVATTDPVPEAEHVRRCRCRTPDACSAFVDTATKCLAIAASSPSCAQRPRSRAECAFVSVSSVVNVFDETMNSVSSAERSRVASAKSVESTFETNRNVMSRRV